MPLNEPDSSAEIVPARDHLLEAPSGRFSLSVTISVPGSAALRIGPTDA